MSPYRLSFLPPVSLLLTMCFRPCFRPGFLPPFCPSGLPVNTFVLPGGDEEIRTLDPLLAGQVLSQLSYTPGSFRTLKIEQLTPIPLC